MSSAFSKLILFSSDILSAKNLLIATSNIIKLSVFPILFTFAFLPFNVANIIFKTYLSFLFQFSFKYDIILSILLKGRDFMSDGLDKLTDAIGNTLKTVPTLYEDALQPTAQESGEIFALIPRTIKAALLPLRQWIAEREYKLAEIEKLLAKKLEHISEDKIVTPEAYVAVPAIQAISYSMNSEELRNLYANLLAKAMNSDTKDMVHPSFVEIIKQMSPVDSLVFKTIMQRESNPLIDLVYQKMGDPDFPIPTEFEIIAKNISDIDIAPIDIISLSIDNLVKQNLISIPTDFSYTDNFYDKLLKSQYYISQSKSHLDRSDGFIFSHQKRMIEKTNLGISFYKTCVENL